MLTPAEIAALEQLVSVYLHATTVMVAEAT